MANEVRATATLDDKISPGLTKIEQSLNKFSFSTDGMLSKLARSFSLTDLAVGAIVGSLAALNKMVDKTSAAYLASNQASQKMLDSFDSINDKIKENDIKLGEATSKWKLFWAAVGGKLSDAAVAVAGSAGEVTGYNPFDPADIHSNHSFVGPSKMAQFDVTGLHRPGSPFTLLGKEGADQKLAADKIMSDYFDGLNAAAAKAAEEGAAWMKAHPFDPLMTDPANRRASIRLRGGMKGGPDFSYQEPGMVGGSIGQAGGAYDTAVAKQEKLDDAMKRSQQYVDTLANGLQSAFSGMLFDGMRLSDGLKGIFRSLVDDILGELSTKAATGIVKVGLGLIGLGTGDGAVGTDMGPPVQTAPSALRSATSTLAYERARGR